LTPPGAPAPTMKTLDQIEPRAAIGTNTTPGDANNTFIISQPGSYYLTTNLVGVSPKRGIDIRASGVTLDLNGFAMLGVAGASSGVNIQDGLTNVCVRNGTISGWAGGPGVTASAASNCRYERLRISRNGSNAGGDGLETGPGCVVIGCNVLSNGEIGSGGVGIDAGPRTLVKDCTVSDNAGHGISTGSGSIVTDCAVAANHDKGIIAGDDGTVENCSVSANEHYGIDANARATIKNCTVTGNNAAGIRVVGTAVVDDCVVDSTSGHGIDAGPGSTIQSCATRSNAGSGITVGDGSTVVNCSASGNTNGIVAATGCTIRDCTVRGNTLDGIQVTANCSVVNNTASGNAVGGPGWGGIHVTGNGNRLDGNHVVGNLNDGILMDSGVAKNTVVRNYSGSNGNFQYRFPGPSFSFGDNIIGQIYADATNSQVNAWSNFSN